MALDLVGFGEAMALFQPESGDLRHAAVAGIHVAGAELNLCAAAARTGLRVGFCSRVGADPLGGRVLDHAAAYAVSTELVAVDEDHPTGLFLKDVHPDGVRRVHYYRRGSAASMMDISDAHRALAVRPRMVAVSGITSALGPGPRRAVRTLLDVARSVGVLTAYDPNLRPALGDLDGQLAEARHLLPRVDYLLLGVDEAEPLFGTADPEQIFAAAGAAEVVLKAGAEGCWYATPSGPAHLPAQAATVVDPVGAGDAFGGGYLAARLSGADPARAAWLGSVLAAGVVAAHGDTDGLPEPRQAYALLTRAVTKR